MSGSDQQANDQTTSGPVTNGRFQLKVSPDKLAVYLDRLQPPSGGGEPVTVNSVLAEIKKQKITFGINLQRITEILTELNEGRFTPPSPTTQNSEEEREKSKQQFLIVKGEPTVQGRDAILQWQINETRLAEHNCVVAPNELLVTVNKAIPGAAGKNVFGKLLVAQPVKEISLAVGEGVAMVKTEHGAEYRATCPGIVEYQAPHLSINPKITVSEDGMHARLDLYAQSTSGAPIEYTDLLALIKTKGINYGLDNQAIYDAVKRVHEMALSVPMACVKQVKFAKGAPPVEGKDARLIIHKEHSAGLELSHGRVDHHEHDYPWNVAEGETIGYLFDAKPASDGMTIFGTPIKATPPKQIELNLTGIHRDERGKLIADVDGALLIDGTRLSVVELLLVGGDLNQETGNVHTNTAVHIKGHVAPGFTLESQKEVIIDNNIENATVRAGGNLTVKGGIRGDRSKVFAPGDVTVGFIENAAVFVNGNLTVMGSIINSTIGSNNTIIVGGKKGNNSAVIGGELTARSQLEAAVLGSHAYLKTVIRIGLAQETRRKLNIFKSDLINKENELTRLDQIKHHYKSQPGKESAAIMQKVNATREALAAEIDSIQKQLDELMLQINYAESAKVIVHKRVYPGVVIYINEHIYEVKHERGGGVFSLEEETITFHPA